MATPAAVLSILVSASSVDASATLSKFDKQLAAVGDVAKKGIETRLAGVFDPEAFDRYEEAMKRAARVSKDREAFRAELGANYSPAGFREYQKSLDQAAAATEKADAAMKASSAETAAAMDQAAAASARANELIKAAGAETGASAGTSSWGAMDASAAGLGVRVPAAAQTAGVADEATRMGSAFDGAGEKATSMFSGIAAHASGALHGLGIMGVAVGAIGYESIKAVITFQAQMERLQTQAGASSKQVKVLSSGVQNIAPSVGTGPVALAQAMYHVVSSLNATIPAAQRASVEMKVLRIAAEGAKVGGADLVDVTNALDAAIVSGIKGAQNYSQAMGALNATVGAGDMTMQDLADSFGTGVVVQAKLAGISITQLGGALAVLGDNNIRGAKAGTLMASALRIMKAPSDAAAKALAGIGLSATSLASALRSGGVAGALTELRQHLAQSGDSVTGTAAQMDRAGLVITRAFGGRQSSGLQDLLGQLDRLKAKTADVAKGSGGFGAAWTHTTHTLSFELDQVKAAFQVLENVIGAAMAPIVPVLDSAAKAVSKFVLQIQNGTGAGGKFASIISAAFNAVKSAVVAVTAPFGGLRNVLLGVAAAAAIVGAAMLAMEVPAAAAAILAAMNPVTLTFMAVAAAAALIIDHWKLVEPFFAAVFDGIKSVAGPVIAWLEGAWRTATGAIMTVAKAVFPVVKQIVIVAFDAIKVALAVLKVYFQIAWNVIRTVVGTEIKLIEAVIKQVLVPAFKFVEPALELLKSVFTSVFGEVVKIVKAAVNLVLEILSKLASAASATFKFLSGLPVVGHALFGGLAGDAKNAAEQIDQLRDAINGVPSHKTISVTAQIQSVMGHGADTATRTVHAVMHHKPAEHSPTYRPRVSVPSSSNATGALPGSSTSTISPGTAAAIGTAVSAGASKQLAALISQRTADQVKLAATPTADTAARAALRVEIVKLTAQIATARTSSDAATKAQKAQTALLNKLAGVTNVSGDAGGVMIPSQAVGFQTKLAQLSNTLAAAQNSQNTGAQDTALTGTLSLQKKMLAADKARMVQINSALKIANLSTTRHAQLLQDRLSVLQDISTLLGNIGSTQSSLAAGGTGSSSSTSQFDLAPGGSAINVPTVYDARKAVGGREFGSHTHQHGDLHFHIEISRDVDLQKLDKVLDKHLGDALDRPVSSRVHAKLRSAGMRGT